MRLSLLSLIPVVLNLTIPQGQVSAQRPDTVLSNVSRIADLGNAVGFAVGPSGLIYVVESDGDRIVVLDSTGVQQEWFGGSGTDEGQFDEVRDVDPTNGLIINVADAGNGRIQRFARSFRFLESIRLSDSRSSNGRMSSFRTGAARVDGPGQGYPISVTSSSSEDLYAVDASIARVIRWDRERRNRWIIGGEDAEEGELLDPVSVAVSGELLYVADRTLSGVIVYDLFGTYVRSIGRGVFPDIRSIWFQDNRLGIVLGDRVVFYGSGGSVLGTLAFSLDQDLVDAWADSERVYLLTQSHLYRVFLDDALRRRIEGLVSE
jgi:hypothetical protein